MFDKNKLLTQLDSLMSLAAANDIEYQAGQFSHVKNVAEILATLLSKKAEEEAAAEKAAADKVVADKVHSYFELVEKYDIVLFLLRRGRRTFCVMAKAITEECLVNMAEAMFQEAASQLDEGTLFPSTAVEVRGNVFLTNLIDKDLLPEFIRKEKFKATYTSIEVGLTAKLYL